MLGICKSLKDSLMHTSIFIYIYLMQLACNKLGEDHSRMF